MREDVHLENRSESVNRMVDLQKPELSTLVRSLNERGFPIKDLDLKILFGEHGTVEQARRAWTHISQCQIFVLELPFWTEEDMVYMQNVSDGTEGPQEYFKMAFLDELMRQMAGSHIRIVSADLPANEPGARNISAGLHMWLRAIDDIRAKKLSYVEAQHFLFGRYTIGAEVAEFRESYIKNNLGSALARALSEDPRLETAEHISGVLFMGAAHTSLIPKLKDIHPTSEHTSLIPNTLHTFESEVMRRLIFEHEIPTQLLEDALTERILSGIGIRPNKELPEGEQGKAILMRSTIPALSPDEQEHLYDAFLKGDNEAFSYFNEIIAEKEIGPTIEKFLAVFTPRSVQK